LNSRGEDSKKSANQKQESPEVAMFVMDRDGMSNLHRGPSIDASYQVSDHLAQRFQRRRILQISQSETRADPLINMATTDNSCF
jgi:hypothetical protein